MSNSIWKKPDQKPKGHKTVIEHWLNCYNEHCYDMWGQRPDGGSFDSHTIEWCYLDELLAQADKAERLQKAVEVAKMSLEDCNKILSADMKDWGYLTAEIALKKIEQMIGQN